MNLLTVIPITKESWQQAENLLDFIYALSGRETKGSCLIVAAPDVHEEYSTKVLLSAEVAFEHARVHSVISIDLFMGAAKHVAASYRMPWLWLEPDCVPIKNGWLDVLGYAYESQPMRYMGAHLKIGDKVKLARQSVFAVGAAHDKSDDWTPASTKCRLIQQGTFDKATVIRDDAVLFCSDKTGELIKSIRSELKPKLSIKDLEKFREAFDDGSGMIDTSKPPPSIPKSMMDKK